MTKYNIITTDYDDMPKLFPINCKNLIEINPVVWLTPKNLSQLVTFIACGEDQSLEPIVSSMKLKT